ncbi:MAG: TolC family protein, partial [Muribaculaceae bacterium]|nr:TolC family protein [Muribaculaceae bacterium]
MKRIISFAISFLSATAILSAATPLTLDSCLSAVINGNIGLAAERLNLFISDAEEIAARVYNDPTIGVEYANNDDHRMQMGQSVSVELGYTFSPGRRGAAIDLAHSEKQLARALFDDYLRCLRCEATIAYFEAIKEKQLYVLALSFSERMDAIARGDSLSLAIGEIRKVDAMATGIEARKAQADARAAYARYHDAMLNLALLMGDPKLADSFEPVTEAMPCLSLSLGETEPSDADLVAMAIERRADLRAAMGNVDVAAKALTVARRERNVEFDVTLGYNYNTEVRKEIAPAPTFSGMPIGVSIP